MSCVRMIRIEAGQNKLVKLSTCRQIMTLVMMIMSLPIFLFWPVLFHLTNTINCACTQNKNVIVGTVSDLQQWCNAEVEDSSLLFASFTLFTTILKHSVFFTFFELLLLHLVFCSDFSFFKNKRRMAKDTHCILRWNMDTNENGYGKKIKHWKKLEFTIDFKNTRKTLLQNQMANIRRSFPG